MSEQRDKVSEAICIVARDDCPFGKEAHLQEAKRAIAVLREGAVERLMKIADEYKIYGAGSMVNDMIDAILGKEDL